MSEWGIYDSKSITGTSVAVTNGNTAIVGTGTKFTANLAIGDVLVIKSNGTVTKNRVAAIADDTHLTLADAFLGTTNASLVVTANVALQEQPLYVYTNGGTNGQNSYTSIQNVYGVKASDVTNTTAKLAHSGWVKATVGTGGRSGRTQYEVLVANGTIANNAIDNETFPG